MSTPSTNTQRLYIGNLDYNVDEYAIVKLFEQFGKITFIELMLHTVGPRKGISRGFCFLEFEKKQQGLNAIHSLHGKVIKGKPLVVSFAHMTPEDSEARKEANKHQKRSLFSVKKKAQNPRVISTDAKIAAIEKKLSLLQQKDSKNGETSKGRYKPY